MHQLIPSERADLQEAAHAFACWERSRTFYAGSCCAPVGARVFWGTRT